jgi:hypothetical protein
MLTALVLAGESSGHARAQVASAPVPKMLTDDESTDFAVRPAELELADNEGGEISIHWSSWTAKTARGTGTTDDDHGSHKVAITLTMPVREKFRSMTVTSSASGKRHTAAYRLAYAKSDSEYSWATLSSIRRPGSGLELAP